jgi:O-methyltransferase involved in polyketide biosynthesis
MNEKIKIELGEVQKTLLMPLWGRAKEYLKENPLIKDEYAYKIINKLDYDFDRMSGSYNEHYQVNWATRAYHIDKIILNNLADFPDATIVNLGAGLDTTFQRIDNGRIFWYDLDLPDTIELRKKLIPESARNRLISKSILDFSWCRDVVIRGSKVIFIAAGVFCYFDKKSVTEIFLRLIQEFPGSEIIFETMSKMLIWLSNRQVAHKRGKAELSKMQWGCSSSKEIKKWSDKIQVIQEFPIYSNIMIREQWSKQTIFQIRMTEYFKWVNIMHLRFSR